MVNNWKIWNKNYKVEQRTFDRLKQNLPEMESAKQLRKLIQKVYKKKMMILDVGCAAGHYYNSLKKIDKNIKYTGIDATKKYISFAKKFFIKNKKTKFYCEDIYNISSKHFKKFDITFCCNLLLHLPSIEIPLKNLLKSTKKYCFVRTLVSSNTHLSQYLYDDKFKNKKPINFAYQNTYSFEYIKKTLNNLGNFKIKFIEDEFNKTNINKEYKKFKQKQKGATKVFQNNIQISGSKVFEWKWLKISI